MSLFRPRQRRSKSPVYEATEPRGYDRRFYGGALAFAFLAIILATGFAVYRVAFGTEKVQEQLAFDLGSFGVGAERQPDPANPCIVLQDHLEATRRGRYRFAYDLCAQGLKNVTSYDEFLSNAKTNRLLFSDIARYSFERYQADGGSATASGYIVYGSGGRSKVDATFSREGSAWRISLITVIYQ